MDCFRDFCLFCDRESPDGLYCSQTCKLADLEKSSACEASSPKSPTNYNFRSTGGQPLSSSSQRKQPSYHLDRSSNSSSDNRTTNRTSQPSSTSSTSQYSSSPNRQLTPSSSRTSLSSTYSSWAASSPTDALSAQARHDLQDYFSSFNQVRAAKRRSSLR